MPSIEALRIEACRLLETNTEISQCLIKFASQQEQRDLHTFHCVVGAFVFIAAALFIFMWFFSRED